MIRHALSVGFTVCVLAVASLSAAAGNDDAFKPPDPASRGEALEDLRAAAGPAWRQGRYRDGLEILEKLEARDPQGYERDGCGYLAGRCLIELGDLESAADTLEHFIRKEGPITDRAVLGLAGVRQRLGEDAAAEKLLLRFIREFRFSLVRDDALIALSQAEERNGKVNAALISLTRVSKPRHREAGLLSAGILIRADRRAEAASTLYGLLRAHQNDDIARKALDLIVSIRKEEPARTLEQTLLLALTHYYAREFDRASALLDSYHEQAGKSARADAWYFKGMSHYRLGEFDKALHWFSKGRDASASSQWAQRCYFHVARTLSRQGRRAEARATWFTLFKKHPTGKYSDEALLEVLRIRIDDDQLEEADKIAALVEKHYSSRDTSPIALMELAAARCRRKEFDKALDATTRLSALRHKSARAPRARYWHARMLEETGRVQEADDIYSALSIDRSDRFYMLAARDGLARRNHDAGAAGRVEAGFENIREEMRAGEYEKAGDGLKVLAATLRDPKARSTALELLLQCYLNLPDYSTLAALEASDDFLRKAPRHVAGNCRSRLREDNLRAADALLALGILDEALKEYEACCPSSRTNSELQFFLSVLAERAGKPSRSILHAENCLSKAPRDFVYELIPQALQQRLFPKYFSGVVERKAAQQGVDPELVYAVIREESRFDPAIRSGAAARGLMQLIPETALRFASRAGMTTLDLETLYDPSVSITLGVGYLSWLVERFGGFAQAIGAYNAGENAVDRWLGRSGREHPLLFLSSIEYKETKRYVEKVTSTFWMYRWVYGKEPNPWGSFFSLSGQEPLPAP